MKLFHELDRRGYWPRYRLPKVAGCLLIGLLAMTALVGLFVFLLLPRVIISLTV